MPAPIDNAALAEGVGSAIADFHASVINEAALKDALSDLFDGAFKGGVAVSRAAATTSEAVSALNLFLEYAIDWYAGPADGGPGNDGLYPLLDSVGNEYLVPSPAKLADLLANDTGIRGTINLAKSEYIAPTRKTLTIEHYAPTYTQLASFTGPLSFVRASLASLADYPAASYFRHDTDRTMPDGTTDAVNGGYFVLFVREVRPEMFGLFTDGTTTTAAIRAATTFGIVAKRPVYLRGTYNGVNGPIAPVTTLADGSLDLRYEGDAAINVDAASPMISYFFGIFSTAATRIFCGYTGGTLTINCNQRVARAMSIASNSGSTTIGGECHVRGLRIYDVYTDPATNTAAYALDVAGPFKKYTFEDIIISGVSRHADLNLTGDCKGIRVSQNRVPIKFSRCDISGFLNDVQDSDGIFVNSPLESGVPVGPEALFEDCTFYGYQGRAIKTQVRRTIHNRCSFDRSTHLTGANCEEVAAQYGSQVADNFRVNYRKFGGGGTSPLPAGAIMFTINDNYDPAVPLVSRIGKGHILTDVTIPRLVYILRGPNSPHHKLIIDGPVVEAVGDLATAATTAIERAIAEFSLAEIKASSKKLSIWMDNTSAPNTIRLLGYTSSGTTNAPTAYNEENLSAKLGVHFGPNNINTLTPTNPSRQFDSLSGFRVTVLTDYTLVPNKGYRSLMYEAWTVDFNTINPGNDFFVNLAAATILNGPTLPATGTARIQTGGGEFGWFNYITRTITIDDGPLTWTKAVSGWVPNLSALPGTTNNGDSDATLTARVSKGTQFWNTPFTANRTGTLSTTGARAGDWFQVVRTAAATGAFTLTVAGEVLRPGQAIRVEYNGAAWVVVWRSWVAADAGWTAATGTAAKGAYATYAGQNVGAAYVEAEAQATDDAVKALSQRFKALEDAVRLAGVIT